MSENNNRALITIMIIIGIIIIILLLRPRYGTTGGSLFSTRNMPTVEYTRTIPIQQASSPQVIRTYGHPIKTHTTTYTYSYPVTHTTYEYVYPPQNSYTSYPEGCTAYTAYSATTGWPCR